MTDSAPGARANHGPIYIGGPDRSGKTLLAAILGSHSRIAIPIVGSNLWTFFYRRFGDLGQDRNLERCLAALQRYKHARFLGLEVERLRAELRAGPPTYPRLFALIHEHFAQRRGKPRWGDQSGLVERYADHIFEAMPDARMIQMVRDPRDRYEGSLNMWPSGRGRSGAAVARWRYSVRLGERNLRRYPGRYRLLRYEDLVRDPAAVVADICSFVGEDFEPAMLQLAEAPSYREKLLAGAGPGELISARHVGDYRGRIPAHELAFMQQQLAGEMRRHGYEPDPITMAAGSRLRYLLLQWPSQAGRMLAWAGMEAVQQRGWGLLGRRPGGHMIVPEVQGSPPAGSPMPEPRALSTVKDRVRRTPIHTAWRYITFGVGGKRMRRVLDEASVYCLFIGHARSGHSIVGALLDAHPRIVISDELDALRYLSAGFGRRQLLFGSYEISRRQASGLRRKAGRGGKTYSYHVPGQWQGRVHRLAVVGDSQAGWTTRRLAADPDLLARVRRRMAPMDVRFIHVVRNPFDNIATMMVRGQRSFDSAFDQYAANCAALVSLARRIGTERLHRVRHEAVVQDPRGSLAALCGFLGVEAEPAYLEAASGILYASPSRSRHDVEWREPEVRRVQELIDRYDYLSGYGLAD
jgi:hypothetical protein